MLLSAQSQVGLATESSWGNVTTPTIWLPFSQFTTTEQVNRRQMPQVYTDGNPSQFFPVADRASDIRISHLATPDSVAAAFRSILGNESVSGNNHTFTISAMPQTTTVTEYDGDITRAYTGCVLYDYGLTWTDSGSLVCSQSWIGQVSQTVANIVANVPIVAPALGWQASVSVLGNTIGRVVGGKWSMQRQVTNYLYVDGSPDVVYAPTNYIQVSAELDMVVTSESAMDSIKQTTSGDVAVTIGGITLTAHGATWQSLSWDRGNNVLMEKLIIRGSYNSADEGSMSATVTL